MVEIPKTAKAAVIVAHGKPLEIREFPIPDPEPGAILVKQEIAGICGSDVHHWRGELIVGQELPAIPGHEFLGRIVKLGEGVREDSAGEPLKIDDRIMWAHVDCGECYGCEVSRDSVQCSNRAYYGYFPSRLLGGGFAEYSMITPLSKVVKVPDELSEEETVGVGCAFRTVVGGFERFGDIGFQDTVVVQGAGPVGLYSALVASESGAGNVIVLGAPAGRLELAEKWGADAVINIDEIRDSAERRERILALTEGRGPEIVIECSGVPVAFNEGLDMIQRGGRYLVMGQTSAHTIPMAPGLITGKGIEIIGASGASIPHYYKALQFIRNKRTKVPLADIVTHKFALEDINDAYEVMASGEAIKPVIDNRGR